MANLLLLFERDDQYRADGELNLLHGMNIQPKFNAIDQKTNDRI